MPKQNVVEQTPHYEWDIFVNGLYFGTSWFKSNSENEVLAEVVAEFDRLPFSLLLHYIHVEKPG